MPSDSSADIIGGADGPTSIIVAEEFPEEELIVVYDDISLAPGQLRVRGKGSAGGHNGIKNIILHTGGQKFPRVRVGVGEKPADYDLADYVLGHFSKEDQKLMDEAFKEAADAAAKKILSTCS